jgi:DNA-binding MarR family transcriptional regulator
VSSPASPPLDHTANLLGALSLSVADRTADTVGDAAGQSQTAAIALSALNDFLEAPSIDRLRSVLGLTPSGAVRLVDRLQDAGYVARGPGADARSVSLHLTPAGRRVARRVAAARAQVLEQALRDLTAAERETLDRLLSRMLTGMIRGPGATRWMCRFCDTSACGRGEGRCPVANEARRRYAS